MPARRIKSLYKELGHRAHREHRSKKGREPRYGGDYTWQERKRRMQEEVADELFEESMREVSHENERGTL